MIRARPDSIIALGLLLGVSTCAEYRIHAPNDAGADGSDGGPLLDDGGLLGTDGGPGDAGGEEPVDAGFDVCTDVGRRVSLSPLDLFVMLDVSGSMDYDLKWVAVKDAMTSFVTRPEFDGLGVSVQYFPLRALCRVDVYETPAIPVALLPGNAQAIVTSLGQQRMSGGTPTATAIQGVVNYAQAHLALPENAGRKATIVLATDGVPDGTCSGTGTTGLANTIENVVTVATGAATSSPPVQTFVIGVGKELGALDAIAQAGGTTKAVLVDTAGNTTQQFLDALKQIRRDALGCDFPIPQVMGTDPTKARVRFLPDAQAPVNVPQVTDVSGCGQSQGWYFDDPSNVSKIVLCPVTCDLVTQGTTGDLKVEFACGFN